MARHIPHLLLPGPWEAAALTLSPEQKRHLQKVLRREPETPVTYTDGHGASGTGRMHDGHVERGPEESTPRPTSVHLAVAPPRSVDRQRWVVEKLQELGVARLTWLSSDHGRPQPPSSAKCRAWADAALEQSRGSWRLQIDGPMSVADIEQPMIADPTGTDRMEPGATLCIGPEGGFSPAELAVAEVVVSLGQTILRTETAAVVGAVRMVAQE